MDVSLSVGSAYYDYPYGYYYAVTKPSEVFLNEPALRYDNYTTTIYNVDIGTLIDIMA